jgi:hypothetical protein
MILHRIIMVTSALLLSPLCLGMEKELATRPWQPVERDQSAKKYIRRLPQQNPAQQTQTNTTQTETTAPTIETVVHKKIDYNEIIRNTNYDELMRRVKQSLTDNPPICEEPSAEELAFIAQVEQKFEAAFGYKIPTSVDDYVFGKHRITMPLTQKQEQELRIKAQEEEQRRLAEAQEKLRIANEKKAELERVRLELAAENKRIAQKTKELERVLKEKEKAQKKNEEVQEQIRIAQCVFNAQQKEKAKKKEAAAKKTAQQKPAPQQSAQRPEKTILQQQLAVKKTLKTSPKWKKYNCQTDAQLKEILAKKCRRGDLCCIFKKVHDNGAFHYIASTNELKIIIGDEIYDYDFDSCDYEH